MMLSVAEGYTTWRKINEIQVSSTVAMILMGKLKYLEKSLSW
jgi:hypothetical protein